MSLLDSMGNEPSSPRRARSVRETSAKNSIRASSIAIQKFKRVSHLHLSDTWSDIVFPLSFGYYTFSWVYHVSWLRREICLSSNGNEGFPQDLDIGESIHQTSDRQRRILSPWFILPVDTSVVRRDAKLPASTPSHRLRHLANYHNLAARAGG